MVTVLVCLACLSPNVEAIQVNPKRQIPIRKKIDRKKTPFKVPAPLRASVTYGDLTDQEQDGQAGGGYSLGSEGVIRMQDRDRFTLAHEMFHLLDAQVLTDSDRARFQKILRTKPGAWNQGTGYEGLQSPTEIAADYYAALATGMDPSSPTGSGVGSYVGDFGPKRLRRFGNSLERLLKRRGLSALDLDSYR